MCWLHVLSIWHSNHPTKVGGAAGQACDTVLLLLFALEPLVHPRLFRAVSCEKATDNPQRLLASLQKQPSCQDSPAHMIVVVNTAVSDVCFRFLRYQNPDKLFIEAFKFQ